MSSIGKLCICVRAPQAACERPTSGAGVHKFTHARGVLGRLSLVLFTLFLSAWTNIPNEQAVLRALNKQTGRAEDVIVPVGSSVIFEDLLIEASACFSRPDDEEPESSAFLRIFEVGRDGARSTTRRVAFSGWMMASSPAVSALEHPNYDIWVIGCR
ncbi:MAG: DUF2155 domain-containing protein [Alphaproteobacteria bacterium]|nr:DUF2155 domain-containing protein [Alphaproteobacteria bacterium]